MELNDSTVAYRLLVHRSEHNVVTTVIGRTARATVCPIPRFCLGDELCVFKL